jgi:molybdopterin-guanine dinucleotide biosynthesis protein MobB
VLAVTGHSDTGKTTLVERLVDRLAERGPVATVKHLHRFDIDTEGKDTARHRAAGARTTHGLTDDGDWFATGADSGLVATLDRLAAEHAFVLVEGYSDRPLPKVVLGDREVAPPVLARAADADAVALDEIVAQVVASPAYGAPDGVRAALVAASETTASDDPSTAE